VYATTRRVVAYVGPMGTAPIGELVRTWRARRARSQLDLAYEVGVSPRHLSFVETGRSRPSAELVLALAEHLDVPLRDRNAMLLAAGFAPRYSNAPLDDAAMRTIRVSLQRLLEAHDPFPGLVLDRVWNVVLANRAADRLFALLPAMLREPSVNVFRASLHPEGFAAITTNFDVWGASLVRQLGRLAAATDGPRAARARGRGARLPERGGAREPTGARARG
jgi:transcriptional regulator with XRE-family HTH domain